MEVFVLAKGDVPQVPIKLAGTLVEASRYRPLLLLCGTHKQSGAFSIPALRGQLLASNASAAQPEGQLHVGSDDETRQRLASRAAYPSSLARSALRRQTPEVREAMGRAAEVVAPSSSIRTDGGCPVAQVNDLSRGLTAFDPISTLVVVVEMSKANWLVSGPHACPL